MAIVIMGISLVSVGGIDNANYTSSTSNTNSENHYIQVFGSAPTPVTVYKNQVGITTSATSIRTGPHINYSRKGTFGKAVKLSIIGTAGSFYKVKYNGSTGFVSNATVSIVVPTPATVYKN
ncbi:MAG TPA: SH3 domain-containing protein [Clostridium sp.]